MTTHTPRGRRRPGGFTLVELLVVVFIVILVSAVTLPAVLPALSNRQVSEAARILQAALASARDAAIHANAPRGIRLIPDYTLSTRPSGPVGKWPKIVASRIISIEPAPDVNEGAVTFPSVAAVWTNASANPPPFLFPSPSTTPATTPVRYPYAPYLPTSRVLMVEEVMYQGNIPPPGALARTTPPVSWFWNVRIGDRFRFGDSGRYYTVVGPMSIYNPEYFVNDGLPGASSLQETYNDPTGAAHTTNPQFLFLVNGVDDDGDGYVDNGFNGLDEDLDGYVDNLAEWSEVETWLGSQAVQSTTYHTPPLTTLSVLSTLTYTITRRPVPSPGAQEVPLPSNIVVDLTTFDQSTNERSRLPVDPNTGIVDIMLNQAGQVIPTTTYSSPAATSMGAAFYHFWLSDRGDVYPVPVTAATSPLLPIPRPPGAISYAGKPLTLKKDRQLVTLFTRTGQILTNSIETFDFANAYTTSYDANVPFNQAQLGIREAK